VRAPPRQLLGLSRDPDGDRNRLFPAWRLFIERLADTSPVMLLIEDLHWADNALLDFIDYLVEWSRHRPLFVLTLSRPELAERVRTLANHGRSSGTSHYEHEYVGTNSRLDALQAIVLSGKLAQLDRWTQRRIELATRYRALLGDTELKLTGVAPLARHVYHLFVVRVAGRDSVQAELARRGIQTGVHYPVPCHRQPPLRRFADRPLPVAERAAGQLLSLPMFPHLTDDQVDYTCEALGDVLRTMTVGSELIDAG